MAGYTYSTFVDAIADLMVLGETITDPNSATPSSDDNFNIILPRIIEYAEQRLYRELDLVQTVTTVTNTLTANQRSVTIPGSLIVLQGLNVITPAGSTPDAVNAQRNTVQRVSRDYLNFVWPVGTSTDGSVSVPVYYANQDNSTVLVAPAPSDTFTAEFVGTQRPAPLSSTNTTTILSSYLPDIFLVAAAIYGFGYQRDFSGMSSDPQTAMSWEEQYGKLLASAVIETQRMKAQGPGWFSLTPAPIASPNR